MTTAKVATAGWTIPRAVAGQFPAEGAGLERYATRFDAVEINTTFYRSHQASTYARWVAATPPQFRFAVKLPRTITHEARLIGAVSLVAAFRAEALQLGERLARLVVAHAAVFAGRMDARLQPVFASIQIAQGAGLALPA